MIVIDNGCGHTWDLTLVRGFNRGKNSLRSWRYCAGARLKFWRWSRVPKKGSRDEAVEIPPARKPGILNSPHTSVRGNGLVEGHTYVNHVR